MTLCSIASGSSGNAVYVGNDNTKLLVDAGISKKRIEEGLSELGISAKELDAILITHEHSDHILGLGVMSRQYNLPIYATGGTIKEILKSSSVKEINTDLFVEIKADNEFYINDIAIMPFSTYHDAAEPVAYRFYFQDKSVGILTDCGKYDEYILNSVKGVNALLLESNHDVNMLRAGKYPYKTKQRILSENGHLSNETCGRLLCEILDDNLDAVMLGHISKDNNFDELAFETVRSEVDLADIPYSSSDFRLLVAGKKQISEVINI